MQAEHHESGDRHSPPAQHGVQNRNDKAMYAAPNAAAITRGTEELSGHCHTQCGRSTANVADRGVIPRWARLTTIPGSRAPTADSEDLHRCKPHLSCYGNLQPIHRNSRTRFNSPVSNLRGPGSPLLPGIPRVEGLRGRLQTKHRDSEQHDHGDGDCEPCRNLRSLTARRLGTPVSPRAKVSIPRQAVTQRAA